MDFSVLTILTISPWFLHGDIIISATPVKVVKEMKVFISFPIYFIYFSFFSKKV